MIVGGVTGGCQSQKGKNRSQVSCSIKIQTSASIMEDRKMCSEMPRCCIQEDFKKRKLFLIFLTSVPSLPGDPGGPGGPVAPLGPGLCTKKVRKARFIPLKY